MNKKAYTIVEVLAVVIMISVLSMIIMPLITNYLEKSKEEYNMNLKEQMLISGKNFYTDNKDRIPTDNGAKTIDYVFSSELATLNYLKGEFKDAYDVSCKDKSYVIALNEGNGAKYYPCLICGDDEYKYMTDEEKFYCDKIKNLDDVKANYPTCEVIEEESKLTDNDVEIMIKAGDNGYITRIYVINEKGEITEKLEKEDVDTEKNELTKVIKFTEYGVNKIYAMDNNDNKVYCTTFDYKKPTKTTLNAKIYLVSKEQYDTYKDIGIPDSELKTEYDGNDWTNKYVYVKLDYYTSQYLSMKIGDTDIRGKKYLFITEEGEKTTTINAINVAGQNISSSIITKIDRTAPIVSLSNSSNGSWTNQIVTIGATINESSSGVEKIEYSANKNTWYDSWTNTSSTTATKEWDKEDRNVTMYVKVKDKAGNESQIVSTNIKQDVTAPPKPTVTNSSGGSWTNVAVTVGATSVDDSSKTDHLEYNIGSGWKTDWTSTTTNTASKSWSKANRNYSMQIRAVDVAGNISETATTPVKIDIDPPSMGTHCHYSGRKFRYYFKDTGGSGYKRAKWGYCYSVCPGCPESYTCKYKKVEDRLTAQTEWITKTYKETGYNIALNGASQIQVTTKWIIEDNAGNVTTTSTYTDNWYSGGSYKPSTSC